MNKSDIYNPAKYSSVESLASTPLHILVARLMVMVFGNIAQQSYWNVLPRGAYAYGLLRACRLAKVCGVRRFSACEFGVAEGCGLDLLCRYAIKVSKAAGIGIDVHGFDSGIGLPPTIDRRDHLEIYRPGDFKPTEDLRRKFNGRCEVHLGLIEDTLPKVVLGAPVGFASIDLDYYTSSAVALEFVRTNAMPYASLYFDDVCHITASRARGELLAIDRFNHPFGGDFIDRDRLLPGSRIVSAAWFQNMYLLTKI